ncbi:3-phosphoserine/phosphohydroxythreonine transaminase [Pelomicrobium methylotrophicum]|uniref:Phosphoserine aminotransferase n=1 Tax=Pelomicrobium methylotrophicum TaxID=2602750 RepID=A0A5C7EUL3_9PROT|nr:3-phosphoserine/phosphohydroxythreonine transaminase [Pelomicrobium methylotrophicum]TXF12440.1 3-phosphoserine/phosphohydroxythreonine transaminase [Pelomicrobium methylotrophicum]
MGRVYNFSAGPAVLPEEVLIRARDEMLDWRASGMSVMEMSHRGKEFISIARKAEADLRELMAIPANYKILFLQGGATAQFAAVPMNLLRGRRKADYVNTGHWSKRAIAEAKKYCEVHIAASSEDRNFSYVPPQERWELSSDAAYVHITSNETIGGVEYHWIPDTGDVPLVADASSHILSRPIDVSRFGLIYAGAQKNIGPAGLAIVIVREDLIGGALPITPAIFDYKVQAENESMLNTPPTFALYMAGLVFEWLKEKGGLAAMERINLEKARLLYDLLDSSDFYASPVAKADRSRMNVPFTLKDPALEEEFLRQAKAHGLVQLKGHRSVGGMRASIYNAMPIEGVRALVEFMRDFAAKHG